MTYNRYKTFVAGVGFVAILTCLTYLIMAVFACFVAWTPEYWDVTAWSPYARGALGLLVLFYTWVVVQSEIEGYIKEH